MKNFAVNKRTHLIHLSKVSRAISLSFSKSNLFEKRVIKNNLVKKTLVFSALTLPLLMPSALVQANDNNITNKIANGNNDSVNSNTNTLNLNLPAGDLGTQLSRFAAENKLVIYFDTSLTKNLNAKALQGTYSIDVALTKLLSDSGLSFVKETDGAYRVVAANEKVHTLEKTTVTGAEETATSGFAGYAAKRSATGTKTDTPIIETPQSITVVGAEQIIKLKPQTLMDALGYSAGVARKEGADKTSDGFIIRGFSTDASEGSMYRDGHRYTANIYDGAQEPYGLERIEVLKGAASLLYGASSPGGIINTTTKRPTAETIADVGFELGNDSRKQFTADFSGELPDVSDWTYRLTALVRDSDTFVDYVPDNKTYIAPALTWQPSEDTSLTLLSHYQKSETAYLYALPAEGTILDSPNGQIARNVFVGEPGKDRYISEDISMGYLFDHNVNDQVSIHHSLNYFKADVVYDYTWIFGVADDMRTTSARGFQDRQDKSSVLSIDTYANINFGDSAIRHTITAGVDANLLEHKNARYSKTADNLDLYTPTYGSALGERVENSYSSKSKTDKVGLYVQDQIKLQEKWMVNLGLRQEWFEYQQSVLFGDTDWQKEDTDALTGNVGLVYLADNGLAPFMSYSQSYQLTPGTDRLGERFKPSEAEQVEAGLRYQPDNEAWLLSASIYQLVKTNVTTTDPVDVDFSVQTGEVTSKGFELEFKGQLTDDLQIISAYAYTDARTTESNTVEDIGSRTGGVPYNQMSLWADYQFNQFNIPGLTFGAGVRYVGPTRGVFMDAEVPAFTIIDTMLSYESNHWRYALNVSNLTDKTYIASCTYGCFFGEPRKVIVSVNYNF